MLGDGGWRIGGEDRLTESGSVEGKQDGVTGSERSVEGDFGGRDRTANPDSFIPPENAQVFIHGAGIAELIERPQQPRGREFVSVVGIEVDGR